MKPFLLSLYDNTGNWARPYVRAGWRVLLWDKQREGCLLERFSWLKGLIDEENNGRVDGILAAPPCTAFSSSGARWWPDKDRQSEKHLPFDSFTDYMVTLTHLVLVAVEWFKPMFWALENPVGRLERLVPELKPFRQLVFNPCDYGDPYTKKTILWGEFNSNLPRSPVTPVNGSMLHKIPPCPDRAKLRSATPTGFAEAFFQANSFQPYQLTLC